MSLANKSVLLIGCGSVGSEIAHRITSAGIGELTISDPETFNEDNLYRHTLSVNDIDYSKSAAVAVDLRLKHPWAVIEPLSNRLEAFRDIEGLHSFDLIIVAIGSPTQELVFHDFLQSADAATAVMNVWVEAYGVGGHATLDIPNSKGCLRCAYVDPETLTRGLSSNLNFLEPNQDLTVTHAGCGNQFLPYSGVAASYTATMTVDLAVQYLVGDTHVSSKISWKGSQKDAELHGFRMTHRYRNFARPLQVLPLHNRECDVCAD
jgi:molybdopterin/thiamine biosynthesis adenylyltransferase